MSPVGTAGASDTSAWLSTREARRYLEANGVKMTNAGLIHMGRRLDIIRKTPDSFHWEVSRAGLDIYLGSRVPPEGFYPVEYFAEEWDVSVQTARYFLSTAGIVCVKIRGRYYYDGQTATETYRRRRGSGNNGKE